eukprot:4861842-Amphidinium_carterae.1
MRMAVVGTSTQLAGVKYWTDLLFAPSGGGGLNVLGPLGYMPISIHHFELPVDANEGLYQT